MCGGSFLGVKRVITCFFVAVQVCAGCAVRNLQYGILIMRELGTPTEPCRTFLRKLCREIGTAAGETRCTQHSETTTVDARFGRSCCWVARADTVDLCCTDFCGLDFGEKLRPINQSSDGYIENIVAKRNLRRNLECGKKDTWASGFDGRYAVQLSRAPARHVRAGSARHV